MAVTASASLAAEKATRCQQRADWPDAGIFPGFDLSGTGLTRKEMQ